MKTSKLSHLLGFFAFINLILIILSAAGIISIKYKIFGFSYCIFHILFQLVRQEGFFSDKKIKRDEKNWNTDVGGIFKHN